MPAKDATLDWRAAELERTLQALRKGLVVEVVAEVDSTNTRLVERLRGGDRRPCLLVAEDQLGGRGRNGRAWSSRRGASLTFSIGLPLAPADWSGLSLAVGVAVADAIEPCSPGAVPRLQIKWPNDLWCCDAPGRWRKLAGILIETVAAGAERGCVVGVGLNVRPRTDTAGLASGYACVQELDAGLDAPGLLARVAPPLVRALDRFEREGFSPFVDGYAARDLLRGRLVQTGLAEMPQGVAEGVDEQGALRVRGSGGVVAVHGGEVQIRPMDPESN